MKPEEEKRTLTIVSDQKSITETHEGIFVIVFFLFFFIKIYIIVSKTQKAELEVYYLHCIIATFPKTKPALINFSLFYFFFFF